ncbi:MAG: FHA domain-containing protein [Gammaproteobacteria bacterium]|jgi:pSer/pThr/pTyr-binding forkhead associated (FHA) protein
MRKNGTVDLKYMEGHSYIVGREGHIYISDPSVSRAHAEISIVGGKIRLRDLDSTNGTYFIEDGRLVAIKEAIVKPHDTVVLGRKPYKINSLLAIVGVFAAYSNESGLVVNLRQ